MSTSGARSNLAKACALLALLAFPAGADPSIDALGCASCASWNAPQTPFKVVGNTWYVGTAGLSAVLVTSTEGHVLLDGALPESAPLIQASIEALGFRMRDVRLILNSHAHWDHAGGIAALQRASGARVIASEHGAGVLRAGTVGSDDPQYDADKPVRINAVPGALDIHDGEVVRVGELALTAHLSAGHTPGSTSWSWKSCEQDRCYDVVYADSLMPVSNSRYRFSEPATESRFHASIATVDALPCDVLLTPHPDASRLMQRLAARTGNVNTLIDPGGCHAYAASARHTLDERIARERAGH